MTLTPEERKKLSKEINSVQEEVAKMVAKDQLTALAMCMTRVGLLLEIVVERLDRITNEIPVEPVRVTVEL